MAVVSLNCPHCRTNDCAFSIIYASLDPTDQYFHRALACCPRCQKPVAMLIQTSRHLPDPKSHQGDIATLPGVAQISVYPTPEAIEAPEYVPSNIATFYKQALDSRQRGSYDAAGAMFRKTLDVTLKAIHPTGKGTLAKRIKNLPVEIGVTESMKSWADEIRELGNDAAHEEEPFTKEESEALNDFTELFLIYAFTMPQKIKNRQAAKDPEATDGPAV